MMIVSRRGSRLLPPQHYSRASESSADTDVIHHQHHHHLYDDGRRGQQRPGNKIDGLSAAQQRAVTSTAEQNRSTSPTAAAAARPIITSRTCYTSQNRIAYIFINYLFSLILTAPFFLPALPFFSVTSSALTDVEKSKHQTQFSVIVFFLPQTFSSF